MSITKEEITLVFDVWARNYAENPDVFDDMMDINGNLVQDYGERAAELFLRIYDELFSGELNG